MAGELAGELAGQKPHAFNANRRQDFEENTADKGQRLSPEWPPTPRVSTPSGGPPGVQHPLADEDHQPQEDVDQDLMGGRGGRRAGRRGQGQGTKARRPAPSPAQTERASEREQVPSSAERTLRSGRRPVQPARRPSNRQSYAQATS